MITRDRNSNTGFDFDVNIEVNDPDENHSAEKNSKHSPRKGLDKVNNPNPYGYSILGYNYTEDSTSGSYNQSKGQRKRSYPAQLRLLHHLRMWR